MLSEVSWLPHADALGFGRRGHDMILSGSHAVPLHYRMVAGQHRQGLPEKTKEQLRSCGFVA